MTALMEATGVKSGLGSRRESEPTRVSVSARLDLALLLV